MNSRVIKKIFMLKYHLSETRLDTHTRTHGRYATRARTESPERRLLLNCTLEITFVIHRVTQQWSLRISEITTADNFRAALQLQNYYDRGDLKIYIYRKWMKLADNKIILILTFTVYYFVNVPFTNWCAEVKNQNVCNSVKEVWIEIFSGCLV